MSTPLYKSSRHDRPHARQYCHHLNHPAWRDLSPIAFKLLTYLFSEYRPDKDNCFPVGARRVGKLISCSPAAANRAVDELIETGHLRIERRGSNIGHVATRERVVSLSRYDTATRKGDPEFPIKVWRESAEDVSE